MNPMDFSNRLIDKLIRFFRKAISVDFFLQSELNLEKSASFAAPVAAIASAIIAAISASVN